MFHILVICPVLTNKKCRYLIYDLRLLFDFDFDLDFKFDFDLDFKFDFDLDLDFDLDFDLLPILALHIAYGFFPPPLLFTFVTHLSNFFVLSPFFLPCGIPIKS